MEAVTTETAFWVLVGIALIWVWKVLNWLWLKPKKLERILKEQGLQGTPYRILFGDSKEMYKMQMEAKSKPLNLSDDIAPRVSAFVHQTVNKYGICLCFTFYYYYLFLSAVCFIGMNWPCLKYLDYLCFLCLSAFWSEDFIYF